MASSSLRPTPQSSQVVGRLTISTVGHDKAVAEGVEGEPGWVLPAGSFQKLCSEGCFWVCCAAGGGGGIKGIVMGVEGGEKTWCGC